jgi:hypothetical protein
LHLRARCKQVEEFNHYGFVELYFTHEDRVDATLEP